MHRRDADVAAESEGMIAPGPRNVIVDVPHRIVPRQRENETGNDSWEEATSVNLPVTLALKLVEVVSRVELLNGAQHAKIELVYEMRCDCPIESQHAGVVGRLEAIADVGIARVLFAVGNLAPVQVPRSMHRDFRGDLVIQPGRRIPVGIALSLEKSEMGHVRLVGRWSQRLTLCVAINGTKDPCGRGIG